MKQNAVVGTVATCPGTTLRSASIPNCQPAIPKAPTPAAAHPSTVATAGGFTRSVQDRAWC